jgi:putative redox protein
VEVRLSHQRAYHTDCENCDERPAQLDVITRMIILHGALDEAQQARLREIAQRCPVHRTLTGTIAIRDVVPIQHDD